MVGKRAHRRAGADAYSRVEEPVEPHSTQERRAEVSKLIAKVPRPTIQQMMNQFGVSRDTIYNDISFIKKDWNDLDAESLAELRRREMTNVNELWDYTMDYIRGLGDTGEFNHQAINAALRISERRSKLFGLDAPTRIDKREKSERTYNIRLDSLFEDATIEGGVADDED